MSYNSSYHNSLGPPSGMHIQQQLAHGNTGVDPIINNKQIHYQFAGSGVLRKMLTKFMMSLQ
jgi:hypothetical protein